MTNPPTALDEIRGEIGLHIAETTDYAKKIILSLEQSLSRKPRRLDDMEVEPGVDQYAHYVIYDGKVQNSWHDAPPEVKIMGLVGFAAYLDVDDAHNSRGDEMSRYWFVTKKGEDFYKRLKMEGK